MNFILHIADVDLDKVYQYIHLYINIIQIRIHALTDT